VRSPRSPSNFSASTSHAGTPCSARVSPATGCTSSFRDRSKSASVRRTARRICSPSWASDMFGEMSVFDPGPRTSTATTITEVRAVSKDRDALRGHGSPIATKSPSSCCGSWPAGCAAPTATWTPLVVGAARVSFVRAAPGPGDHSARGLWGGSSHRRSSPSETVAADNKLCRRRPSTPGRRQGDRAVSTVAGCAARKRVRVTSMSWSRGATARGWPCRYVRLRPGRRRWRSWVATR
jgi:hypothetical protein